MHRTAQNAAAPIITFLTHSPSSSRKTQALFHSLFGMVPISEQQPNPTIGFENGTFEDSVTTARMSPVENWTTTKKDSLNGMFHPLLGMNWDSVASTCPLSGTILHFLSLSSESEPESIGTQGASKSDGCGRLSLLSVTEGMGDDDDVNGKHTMVSDPEAVVKSLSIARRMLASHINIHSNPKFLGLTLAALRAIGKPATHSRLMGHENNGIPLLKLPASAMEDTSGVVEPSTANPLEQSSSYRLREIVLPYFDDAVCINGRSLLDEFSNSVLGRPLTGLYQWSTLPSDNQIGVAFRPLPCATEDMNLPPPTLVFQCRSIDQVETIIEEVGGRATKVGFSGNQQQGQLRVTGLRELLGLDVRFCESESYSTSFAEAEEAVMAGSLEELQSVNVMIGGGNTGTGRTNDKNKQLQTTDPMTNVGDCFVEFRANMKRPSGFFKGSTKRGRNGRIAKSYDMPFE